MKSATNLTRIQASPLLVCLTILVATNLVSCTSWGADGTAVGAALFVALDGFEPTQAADTPTELCSTDQYGQGQITPPAIGPQPGTAISAGYRSADGQLNAYGWSGSATASAESFVERLVSVSSDCDYELYYDSDSDGDGNLDSGGHDIQQAAPWSGSGWTGVAISAESAGGSTHVREIRLVWRADVAVLAIVTEDGGSAETASATVEDFLSAVAQRLG